MHKWIGGFGAHGCILDTEIHFGYQHLDTLESQEQDEMSECTLGERI